MSIDVDYSIIISAMTKSAIPAEGNSRLCLYRIVSIKISDNISSAIIARHDCSKKGSQRKEINFT